MNLVFEQPCPVVTFQIVIASEAAHYRGDGSGDGLSKPKNIPRPCREAYFVSLNPGYACYGPVIAR